MTRRTLLSTVSILAFGFSASAQTTYLGNGNTGFGGPVGLGSLTLSDNGTTITGTINNGNTSSGFNDDLVIYIQTGAGGTFTDTSGFNDSGPNDGSRKAISGIDGSGDRSLMTFESGFLPNYALSLGPNDNSFGGLWQLADGGNGSLPFIASVNLTPTGTGSASSYTFSLPVADIGLTPNSGATFEFFGTYISNTGYRSTETVGGTDSGTQGWNAFTQTGDASYTIESVPEPSPAALASLGGLAALFAWKRKK